MRTLVLLALLAAPTALSAQTSAFSPLLGGYVLYRAAAPWKVQQAISRLGADGALLTSTTPGDSNVSALVVAYAVPEATNLDSFSDSLLNAFQPALGAERSTDASLRLERVVVWTTGLPGTPLIVMDRFVRLNKAILFARVAMPAVPPADRDAIPNRLRAIDDLLTTIHGGGRLLFPDGARLGVKVY